MNEEASVSPGEFYEQLWHEILAANKEFQRQVGALVARETEAFPAMDEPTFRRDAGRDIPMGSVFCTAHIFQTSDAGLDLHKLAMSVVDRLRTREAPARFAPTGQSLNITSHDLAEILEREGVPHPGGRDFVPAHFSPQAIWDALQKHYGGEAGVQEADRQLANDVVDCFWLRPDEEVKRIKGRAVVNVTIYRDPLFSGDDRLGFQSRDRITKATYALARVAERAGLPSHELHRLAGFVFQKEYFIESRQRHYAGPVEIVTYKSRFDFILSEAFEAELQALLGEHADRFQRKDVA